MAQVQVLAVLIQQGLGVGGLTQMFFLYGGGAGT